MTCLVTKHLKFYSRKIERFIWYLSHISLICRIAAIWITLFLKSLNRRIPGLKFRHIFVSKTNSTNSKAFQFWCESLVNGRKTSNVWLPSMSSLCPVRTCFSVTCPRLDENDGIRYKKHQHLRGKGLIRMCLRPAFHTALSLDTFYAFWNCSSQNDHKFTVTQRSC